MVDVRRAYPDGGDDGDDAEPRTDATPSRGIEMTGELPPDEYLYDGAEPPNYARHAYLTSGRQSKAYDPGALENHNRGEAYDDVVALVNDFGAENLLWTVAQPESGPPMHPEYGGPREYDPDDEPAYEPNATSYDAGNTLMNAVYYFGKSFVVDAIFDEADRDLGRDKEIAGKTRTEWKRLAGVENPRLWSATYDESKLPQAVNGWELVGSRPSRVVWAGRYGPSERTADRRLFIEAGKGRPVGVRKSEVDGEYAVYTEKREGDSEWGRTRNQTREYIASGLPSLTAAVQNAIEYMERVPPTWGYLEKQYQQSESMIQHTVAFLFDELLGSDGPYTDLRALQADYDWHVENNTLSLVAHGFTAAEVHGDDRVDEDVGRGVLRWARQNHPDALERAKTRAESDERTELGYMQTAGDWGDLSPQQGQSRLSDDDPSERAYVQSDDRGRDRSGPSKRGEPQSRITDQRFQGPNLSNFGIDPDELEPDVDRDEMDDDERTRRDIDREVGKYRGATGDQQVDLTGDEAPSRDLFDNIQRKERRAERDRRDRDEPAQRELGERGLEEWAAETPGEQAVKDAIENDDNENGNGTGNGNGGGAA